MRWAKLFAATLLLTPLGCSAKADGASLGRFRVDALREADCGEGLIASSPERSDWVHVRRLGGDLLQWQTIEGVMTLAPDGEGHTGGTQYQYDLRAHEDDPPCLVYRTYRLSIDLPTDGTATSFEGSETFDYSQLEGQSCVGAPALVEALPCTIRYGLQAERL